MATTVDIKDLYVDLSKVDDTAALTKIYHMCPALAIQCCLEGDMEMMSVFEQIAYQARARVADVYESFDEPHLLFYRDLRNQLGTMRCFAMDKDLANFKFKDERILVEALQFGVDIPDYMMPNPRESYKLVRPIPKASCRKVHDMLIELAIKQAAQRIRDAEYAKAHPLERIEPVAARRAYKPSLARCRRSKQLNYKRDDKWSKSVRRNRAY